MELCVTTVNCRAPLTPVRRDVVLGPLERNSYIISDCVIPLYYDPPFNQLAQVSEFVIPFS